MEIMVVEETIRYPDIIQIVNIYGYKKAYRYY